MRSTRRFRPSSLELNYSHAAGYYDSTPEPRLPLGLSLLLAGASSLFLWSMIGAALWQLIG